MLLLALALGLAACSSPESDSGTESGTDSGVTATTDGGSDGGSTTWTSGELGDLTLTLDDGDVQTCDPLCGFVGLTSWTEAGPFEIAFTLHSDLDGQLKVEVDPFYGADDTRFCVAQELTVGKHQLTAAAEGLGEAGPVAVVVGPCG